MTDRETIRTAILERLREVIDPETGVDVVRMRLIEDLTVEESGFVRCKFRPSSPLCPLAVPLAQMIQVAVASVPGVSGVDLEVVGYMQAEELTELLRRALEEKGFG